MPLYELFCIASHNPTSPLFLRNLPPSRSPISIIALPTRPHAQQTNLRQLVEGLTRQIHNDGGVVRELRNLGIGLTLPNRVKRHQQYYTRGDHFTILFDSSPLQIKRMDEQMNRDPLVLKWTMLKKGNSLATLLPKPTPSIDFGEFASRDLRSLGE